jgi:hypothetical protein
VDPHEKPGPLPLLLLPQLGVGPVMTGLLNASSAAKNSSCESWICAPACTGRTHAKSCGEPEYWIWSQSTDCCGEIENAIRCPVTTVTCRGVGGEKHPPHACAGRAGSIVATAASAPTIQPPKTKQALMTNPPVNPRSPQT